ncbi:MAG TPA: hypothetical protein VF740_00120 [Candidatus Acidoferrum sp.]
MPTGDKGESGESGSRAPALQKARVLSGMRPTGRMHIGNYFGALANWVRLQNDGAYDCFYFIADWHSLTSDYADTSGIAENVIEIATDYLAGGLHPDRSVLFLQSLVPEHAELHLLLSMVTPLGWLERVPTYKEALENIKDKDLHGYGFLGYPVLQCADIVMYSELGVPLWVPVGEDQVSHVETSREIVRRFNFFFGLQIFRQRFLARENLGLVSKLFVRLTLRSAPEAPRWDPKEAVPMEVVDWMVDAVPRVAAQIGVENLLRESPEFSELVQFVPVLTEPGHMLTQTPRIPGLDGRKMSKSYGNAITLSESDADIRAKTKVMVTDPARKRRTDPGNPDVCPVYDWHKLFSTKQTLDWAAHGCRTAGIGCIECKAKMADHLIEWITPVRERRVEYEKHPARVLEVIDAGSKRARKVAQGTMERVREAVFGWEKKRREIGGAAGVAKA